MKKIFLIILIFSSLNAFSQDISNIYYESLKRHLETSERNKLISQNKDIYIRLLMFNIDRKTLPRNLGNSKLVYLDSKQIKKIIEKEVNVEENYYGYFTINLSFNGHNKLVVYIQNKLKSYINGNISRFEFMYDCNKNEYILINHKYKATDDTYKDILL